MKNTLKYEKELKTAMAHIGLFYDSNTVDADIRDIITESLMFITFIIEIEQALNIEIPDEYLNIDRISSLRHLDKLLVNLTRKNNFVHVIILKLKKLYRRFFA